MKKNHQYWAGNGKIVWLNLIKTQTWQNLIEFDWTWSNLTKTWLNLNLYHCMNMNAIYISRQWKNINIEQEMGKLFAFHIWCKIATVNKHGNLICYAQMSTNNARKGNWHGSRSWSNITCHIIMHFIAKIFMELQFTFLKFQWFHRTVW